MPKYIYHLSDPDSNDIVYVGQTTNPYYRLIHHISDKRDNAEKHQWISSLKSKNKKPILTVLEAVDSNLHPTQREEYYINLYTSMGFKLFNKRLDLRKSNLNIQVGFLMVNGSYFKYIGNKRFKMADCTCVCGKNYHTYYGNLLARPRNRSCGCMLNKTRKMNPKY